MLRKTAQLFAVLALLTVTILCVQCIEQTAFAQTSSTEPAQAKEKGAAPKMTKAQKIALATSAGPAEIAKNATIMDMTGAPSTKPTQLRAGTNGWVCYAMVDQPMCLDREWQKWVEAWTSKGDLKIDEPGVGYMLSGDHGASNTDPYAAGPTADNQWVVAPPHVMLLYPDPKMLDAYPTDPKNGGPWVMWKGTPYAHIMLPVSRTKAPTMVSK